MYNDLEGPRKSTKLQPGHWILAMNQTWHLPKINTSSQHRQNTSDTTLFLSTFYNNVQHPASDAVSAYSVSPSQLHCELTGFDEI